MFLQPDPAGLIDGPNLYWAFHNDPVNVGDPTGMWAQLIPPVLAAMGLMTFESSLDSDISPIVAMTPFGAATIGSIGALEASRHRGAGRGAGSWG